jgi:hypothetical protein
MEAPLVLNDAWTLDTAPKHRSSVPTGISQNCSRNCESRGRVCRSLSHFCGCWPSCRRVAGIDAFQRCVYVFTLMVATLTAALLVAPVAVHRLMFQRGTKARTRPGRP